MISLICLTNISRHNTVELSKEISDSEKNFLQFVNIVGLQKIIYLNKNVLTEERGMSLAIQIETLFKEKCDEYKEKVYYVEPTKEAIIKEMRSSLEEKYQRPLSDDELTEIQNYVNSVPQQRI